MKFLTNSVWAVLLMVLLSGAAQAQPAWQWAAAQTATSTGSSRCTAMVRDGAGNLIVAGTFTGTITLGTFEVV